MLYRFVIALICCLLCLSAWTQELEQLKQDLSSADDAVKLRAIQTLSWKYPENPEAIELMIDQLDIKDENAYSRVHQFVSRRQAWSDQHVTQLKEKILAILEQVPHHTYRAKDWITLAVKLDLREDERFIKLLWNHLEFNEAYRMLMDDKSRHHPDNIAKIIAILEDPDSSWSQHNALELLQGYPLNKNSRLVQAIWQNLGRKRAFNLLKTYGGKHSKASIQSILKVLEGSHHGSDVEHALALLEGFNWSRDPRLFQAVASRADYSAAHPLLLAHKGKLPNTVLEKIIEVLSDNRLHHKRDILRLLKKFAWEENAQVTKLVWQHLDSPHAVDLLKHSKLTHSPEGIEQISAVLEERPQLDLHDDYEGRRRVRNKVEHALSLLKNYAWEDDARLWEQVYYHAGSSEGHDLLKNSKHKHGTKSIAKIIVMLSDKHGDWQTRTHLLQLLEGYPWENNPDLERLVWQHLNENAAYELISKSQSKHRIDNIEKIWQVLQRSDKSAKSDKLRTNHALKLLEGYPLGQDARMSEQVWKRIGMPEVYYQSTFGSRKGLDDHEHLARALVSKYDFKRDPQAKIRMREIFNATGPDYSIQESILNFIKTDWLGNLTLVLDRHSSLDDFKKVYHRLTGNEAREIVTKYFYTIKESFSEQDRAEFIQLFKSSDETLNDRELFLLMDGERKVYTQLMKGMEDVQNLKWPELKKILDQALQLESNSFLREIIGKILSSARVEVSVGFANYIEHMDEARVRQLFDAYGDILAQVEQPQAEFRLLQVAGKQAQKRKDAKAYLRYLVRKQRHPEAILLLKDYFSSTKDPDKLLQGLMHLRGMEHDGTLVQKLLELSPAMIKNNQLYNEFIHILMEQAQDPGALSYLEGQVHQRRLSVATQQELTKKLSDKRSARAFYESAQMQKLRAELGSMAGQAKQMNDFPWAKNFPLVFDEAKFESVFADLYQRFAGHPEYIREIAGLEARHLALLPRAEGGLGYLSGEHNTLVQGFVSSVKNKRGPQDFLIELHKKHADLKQQPQEMQELLIGHHEEGLQDPERVNHDIERAIKTRYYDPQTATRAKASSSSSLASRTQYLIQCVLRSAR